MRVLLCCQSKEEVLNEFRKSNTKTISMVPEQMDVRIYGDTAIMIIQLRSREQTPDGHTIDHRGRPERKCLCGAVAGNSSHNLPVHRWSSSCPLHASDRISRSDIGPQRSYEYSGRGHKPVAHFVRAELHEWLSFTQAERAIKRQRRRMLRCVIVKA